MLFLILINLVTYIYDVLQLKVKVPCRICIMHAADGIKISCKSSWDSYDATYMRGKLEPLRVYEWLAAQFQPN